MSRPAALVLACVAALALTGCSLGRDAFNTNDPDGRADPVQQQVVRTPEVVSPDLPYTAPPLVEPLPGATGGVPGEVPTSAGEASPGEGDHAQLDQQ